MAGARSSSRIIPILRSSTLPTAFPPRSSYIPSQSRSIKSSAAFAFHVCPQCQRSYLQPFTSTQRFRSSSRRQLTTKTIPAYRPTSLNHSPPPPRNTDVPETSIAGSPTSDATARGQAWPGRAPPAPSVSSAETSTTSDQAIISEQVAQEPKPVPQVTSLENHSTTTPSRPLRPTGRSRLRARKAAMTLTPAAVEHLRDLLDSPEPKLIRVGVKNKGCSGSAYHLEYVDKPAIFDEQVEQDGVKVLIDSKALIKVIGSEMDWVEDKLSARFTFRNPNITEQCGCGESFSIG